MRSFWYSSESSSNFLWDIGSINCLIKNCKSNLLKKIIKVIYKFL